MEEPLRGYLTKSNVAKVAAVLRDGGVVVLPTDTIYGIHCIVENPDAVRRVRKVKERGRNTGFILLAYDMKMVDRLVGRWPKGSRELLSRIWPAPLTAILPASKIIDPSLAPKGTIAVRIPALRNLRRCIKLAGHPLVSTSVNITGEKPLLRISEIVKEIPDLAAYISQRGRPGTKPSTIVDITTTSPHLLRPGRHPWPLQKDLP